MAKRYKTIPIQINYDDQTLAPNYSSTQVPTSNIAISDVARKRNLSEVDAEILSTYVIGLNCPDVR